MKAQKLDHIHVYVKDINKAREMFSGLLGTTFTPIYEVEEIQAKASISPIGIELLEGTSPTSVISKGIEKRGEGVFALSFKVDNLDEAIKEFQEAGLRLVGRGHVGDIQEAQFHPKDSFGTMIELCEYEEEHGIAVAIKR